LKEQKWMFASLSLIYAIASTIIARQYKLKPVMVFNIETARAICALMDWSLEVAPTLAGLLTWVLTAFLTFCVIFTITMLIGPKSGLYASLFYSLLLILGVGIMSPFVTLLVTFIMALMFKRSVLY